MDLVWTEYEAGDPGRRAHPQRAGQRCGAPVGTDDGRRLPVGGGIRRAEQERVAGEEADRADAGVLRPGRQRRPSLLAGSVPVPIHDGPARAVVLGPGDPRAVRRHGQGAARRRLVEDTEVGVEDLHGAPAAVVGERDADPALRVRRQLVVEAGQVDGLAVDGEALVVDVDEGHGELGADRGGERVDADGAGDPGCGRLGRGRDVAPRGRPDHAGADGDGYRQDGGDRGAGHHGAAALDPTGARADVGDGERGALQGVGGAVQRVVHLVLEGSGAHRASSPDSWGLRECGARARSAASARLACDLTVPTEMPSTSAISASLSCS